MAVRLLDLVMGAVGELRTHPVSKWVRAMTPAGTVVDSRAAVLVWEPRRVVPSYAVPVADVSAELVPWTGGAGQEQAVRVAAGGPPVLDPRTPFTVHTTPGTALTVRTADGDLDGAVFAPDDPDLAGYVVLDWDAFPQWYEEDEPVVGHPHDPFDRIDCLRSTRHVVVALEGVVLAETRRPTLLFETPLPTRYYLPGEDVRRELLTRSGTRTVCAYKGTASYWSLLLHDRVVPDAVWSYERPLHDAAPVAGLLCFFTERFDVTVDGVAVPRPVTPWS